MSVHADSTPGRHRVHGEADADATALALLLGALAPDAEGLLVLDLSELEVPTGAACAAWVDALRALLDSGRRVSLEQAPQSLAHVLYRTGLLPRLARVDARTDEPAAP